MLGFQQKVEPAKRGPTQVPPSRAVFLHFSRSASPFRTINPRDRLGHTLSRLWSNLGAATPQPYSLLQSLPIHSWGQRHEKSPTPSTHVPLCWQGVEAQLSMSTSTTRELHFSAVLTMCVCVCVCVCVWARLCVCVCVCVSEQEEPQAPPLPRIRRVCSASDMKFHNTCSVCAKFSLCKNLHKESHQWGPLHVTELRVTTNTSRTCTILPHPALRARASVSVRVGRKRTRAVVLTRPRSAEVLPCKANGSFCDPNETRDNWGVGP